MSDFDKEAEREKLREKFERDEEKREATRQMSELLLKGATMTNRHCDTCGDPLFRYDGQTFCPSCSKAAGEAGEVQQQAPEQPQQASQGQRSAEPPQQRPETVPDRATEVETAKKSLDLDGEAGDGSPTPGEPGADSGTRRQPAGGDGGPAALEQALTSAARRAAAADDPRQAREWLEAAREAAEALAALSR